MRILIAGSSGLIGSALIAQLRADGHHIVRLVRRKETSKHEIYWDPDNDVLEQAALEGFDAIVHLGGKGIGLDRLTEHAKANITKSRVGSTKLLVDTVLSLKQPPKVFACASAVGFYGNRGNEKLTEQSTSGSGFLAELCHQWEAKVSRLSARPEIRAVSLRLGVVLSSKGGALKIMLIPFRLGLGGKLGDGGMYMSWISLTDTARAIAHVLTNESLRGPVNIVGPEPATNLEFTKSLGSVLHRPIIIPVPAFALRLLFGEGADAIMLNSQRVFPEKLTQSGFRFTHPDLVSALAASVRD